jgi:phosphate-selective porin
MNVKLSKLVIAALASTSLMGFGGLAHADSTNDIVNALVMKGVLTEEEGALLTKGHTGEMSAAEKNAKKEKDHTVHAASKMNIRGYLQVRNATLSKDAKNVNLFSDRSVANKDSIKDKDGNFVIRRARLIISGSAGDRLDYYLQPDFASGPSGASTNGFQFAQLRDYYGDLNITKDKVHRIRVGQSKVPFGFENLQSSQNRLALDRADALNSAVKDERDIGAFYYYTPSDTQKLFKEIMDLGLKHSGNYGMFALGAYNGQGANQRESNDNYHLVARATYPWKTESGQIYEMGIQGYTGKYIPSVGTKYRKVATPTVETTPTIEGSSTYNKYGIKDERAAISFMMYPMPFGLQGEWNWGKTPGLDAASGVVKEQKLDGGYVQAMYKIDHVKVGETDGTLIPFVRWQYFDGFQKAETNAPQNKVNDWETGVEWQIAPEVELVAYWHHMNRTNVVTGAASGTADYKKFNAEALRVQLQYNF